MTAKSPEDLDPAFMEGTVVIREQADGTWKFVIDDPGWNPA